MHRKPTGRDHCSPRQRDVRLDEAADKAERYFRRCRRQSHFEQKVAHKLERDEDHRQGAHVEPVVHVLHALSLIHI